MFVAADRAVREDVVHKGDRRSSRYSSGLDAYQYQVVLYSRYPVLWLCKEYGTIISNLFELCHSLNS